MIEAEGSRKDAFVELLKRKDTESKVASAFVRVCSHVLSLRMLFLKESPITFTA
jgi:hypothetical protein